MTGHGAGAEALRHGRVVAELRAVNHRYLDVQLRMAAELSSYAPHAEKVLRKRAVRGRLEASLRLEGHGADLDLDIERAARVLQQLEQLRDRLRPNDPIPLSLLAGIPGLYRQSCALDPTETERAIESALHLAYDSLDEMRTAEGDALTREVHRLVDSIETHLHALEVAQPAATRAYGDRIRARVQAALGGLGAEIDGSRLEQEVAFFVERTDTTEEMARIRSHIIQVRSLVAESHATKGRKLDFIAQELARESNTLATKTHDAKLISIAIDLKADVERLREQVQNVL